MQICKYVASSSTARYCSLLKIKIIIEYLLVSFLLPPDYGETSFHIEKKLAQSTENEFFVDYTFGSYTLSNTFATGRWHVVSTIEIFCHFPVSFFLSFLSAELKKKHILKTSEGFTDISIKIAIV